MENLRVKNMKELDEMKREKKSRNHLFFACKFSEKVWKGLTKYLLSAGYTNQWKQICKSLIKTKTRLKHSL